MDEGEGKITSQERYYINQRITALGTDLKGDIADLKGDIADLKKMMHSHLDACQTQMCKLDDKYDKRVQPLESFKTKVTMLGTLILAVLGLAKFG